MTTPPDRERLVQLRGWTEAEWAAGDPILAAREPGYAIDTGVLKIGDGTTPWSGLAPFGGANAAPLEAVGSPLVAGTYYTPSGGAAVGIPVEGRVLGVPMVAGRDCSISRLATSITIVGTAGAVIRMGIYLWSGTDWELLVDAGTIGAETLGVREIAGLNAGQMILPVAVVQGGAGTRPTVRQLINNYVLDTDPTGRIYDLGIYNCRPPRGVRPGDRVRVSLHGEGRAWDAGVVASDRGMEAGDLLANRLVARFAELGIQRVIWRRLEWDAASRRWEPYDGLDPHTSHLHIELSWAAARGLTIEAVRRALAPPLPPKPPARRDPMLITRKAKAGATPERLLALDGKLYLGHGDRITPAPGANEIAVSDDVWNDIIREHGGDVAIIR